MNVHDYFDLPVLEETGVIQICFSMCQGGLCTCQQRKHLQKHTTIPFHEFPDQ